MKKVIGFTIGIVFFLGLFWWLSQPPKFNNQTTSESNSNSEFVDPYLDYPVYDNPDLSFFWGDGCPHCQNVENWIKENNATEKLKINFKEVYHSDTNQQELAQIAKDYCPEIIEGSQIGVPVGFDPNTKKCVSGDTPIINYLSAKLTQ